MKIESERLAVAKHEKEIKNRSILDTYKLIWKILLIPPIRKLILIVVTCRVILEFYLFIIGFFQH